MIEITQFHAGLAAELPRTHSLLQSAHLVIHEAVERIVLHGSRGISGHPREDSDIDLSLVVSTEVLDGIQDKGEFLRTVLQLLSITGKVRLNVISRLYLIERHVG